MTFHLIPQQSDPRDTRNIPDGVWGGGRGLGARNAFDHNSEPLRRLHKPPLRLIVLEAWYPALSQIHRLSPEQEQEPSSGLAIVPQTAEV